MVLILFIKKLRLNVEPPMMSSIRLKGSWRKRRALRTTSKLDWMSRLESVIIYRYCHLFLRVGRTF